ncbi:peptidoglycan-binding domain-containing protein [Paracoccus luteus]|uniref:peptidoglycan-binding domain-containing protein n=1 Tax=Paracoccus luteus TaxID=2508543 RepID=UPI001C708580|nr:peptidoglycan-binding domain-containing protein [Paracoccus luteus]
MVRLSFSAALCAAILTAGGAGAQQAPVVVGPNATGAATLPGVPPAAAQATNAEDELLWQLAIRRGTADAYRNYLATFPNGRYVPVARARLEDLGVPVTGGTETGGSGAGGSGAAQSAADAARAEAIARDQGAAQGQPPGTAAVPDSATEQALGLTRDQRRAIQSRLTALGHDTRGVDGVFGSGTRRSIGNWQRGQGLPETGYLNRSQADTLIAGGSTAAPAPATDAAGVESALRLTTADRTDIQRRLTALGHDTRGVDGVFGSGTRRAIGAWQRGQGLADTGFLTAAQVASLRGTALADPQPGNLQGAAQAELALNLTDADRTAVQRRLSALGYDTSDGGAGRLAAGDRAGRPAAGQPAGRGAGGTGAEPDRRRPHRRAAAAERAGL